MSARVLTLISALSDVIGKGGTVLSSLDALAPGAPDVIETRTLEGDEDGVTFTLSAAQPIVPYLTARRVVALTMDDGAGGADVSEWRVSAASRRRSGVPRGQMAITLAPLTRDLVDCGWCYDPTLPTPNYTGSMEGTKADFWNAIVAPLLARVGYDYIVLGVDSFPTQTYTWTWDKATPWAVLRAVLSAAPVGACELRLRRDPGSGLHYLDALAEINSGVTVTVGINNAT